MYNFETAYLQTINHGSLLFCIRPNAFVRCIYWPNLYSLKYIVKTWRDWIGPLLEYCYNFVWHLCFPLRTQVLRLVSDYAKCAFLAKPNSPTHFKSKLYGTNTLSWQRCIIVGCTIVSVQPSMIQCTAIHDGCSFINITCPWPCHFHLHKTLCKATFLLVHKSFSIFYCTLFLS